VLRQQQPAETAEALMRSRFTAHVLRDAAHLHRTYLTSARRPFDEQMDAVDDVNWTRLVIHSHEAGPKPDVSTVDFSAYYNADSTEQALHEKSEFHRIKGEWFYVRSLRVGPAPVRSSQAKVGRNDPCPCGSGKKFKHCCGR
jgi:SEC-C motif-containing protein